MRWSTYSTKVPGKWVLAGEHTVLRGGFAIALPHPEVHLRLEFRPSEGNLVVEPDMASPVMHDLLRTAKAWLTARGTSMVLPSGNLKITSTIPFGAGLGSSAALSVATARWVLAAHSLDRSLERELAREMENQFHGKSSGMDVAVVSIGSPIRFSMGEGAVELGIQHLPDFVFIDSGLRASTRECIDRVEALRRADPKHGETLDQEMGRATEEVLSGLRAYDEGVDGGNSGLQAQALDEIARGMDRARLVFAEWGFSPKTSKGASNRFENGEFERLDSLVRVGGGYIVGLKAP